MLEPVQYSDDITCALFLEVPGVDVVLFQAYFELHESLGVVRTIDIKRSLICVLTTTSFLSEVEELLNSIRGEIPWKLVDPPLDADKIFGYSRKNERNNTEELCS